MQSYHDKAFLAEPIPSHLIVPAFGLAMSGDEPDLIRGLHLAYRSISAPDDRPFTYCEVGVASGQTLCAMTKIIDELTAGNWKAFGVDIKNGWSLDMRTVWNQFEGCEDRLTIRLCGSEAFFRENEEPLDFILIDGCHEYDCVKIDFEGAAKSVPIGGIIAFHACHLARMRLPTMSLTCSLLN